ncbi:bestrophin-like domain [Alsobacter sp. R-9]
MSPINWILELAAWSFPAFALMLFLVQIAAREIGYRIGQDHRSRTKAEPEGVGVLVGSMLGLLAFVLALTLSFATSRYDERQSGTLKEANAIGTAWLRAGTIDSPHAKEIAVLLVEYTKLRTEFVQAPAHRPTLDVLSDRTGQLQTRLWSHASALAREKPDPVTALLIAALNDTFDASTGERFAFEKRLPLPLFWLLIGMAIISMAALGYQLGIRGTPLRLLSILLTGMWTLVITDILDLASARLGDIRTAAHVYEWTLQGFEQGLPPPAPPVTVPR